MAGGTSSSSARARRPRVSRLVFNAAVFEWRTFSKPGDVFMVALGFPAIVSDALTTAGTVDPLRRVDATGQSTIAEAAALAQIPISEAPVAAPKQGAAFGGFGVQVVPRKYLVVLEET